jgi:hypothetical protein
MKITRFILLATAVLSLGACAWGQRSTGTGGNVTAPSTTQSGASDSAQIEGNTGAGSP